MDEKNTALPNSVNDATSAPQPNLQQNIPVNPVVSAPVSTNSENVVPASGTSSNTKLIVTVLLLLFVYPVGFVVMWVWTKWKLWIKLLLSLPIILFIVGILMAIVLAAINPQAQIRKAECVRTCNTLPVSEQQTCIQTTCSDENLSKFIPTPSE